MTHEHEPQQEDQVMRDIPKYVPREDLEKVQEELDGLRKENERLKDALSGVPASADSYIALVKEIELLEQIIDERGLGKIVELRQALHETVEVLEHYASQKHVICFKARDTLAKLKGVLKDNGN